MRTCGKGGKIMADKSQRITKAYLKEKALVISENRLAEQEMAGITSPIYGNDSLLGRILDAPTDEDTKLVHADEEILFRPAFWS